MTSAELYQWMADPSLLNKSSLQELRQMVDEFPYFHAVRMLYLKNLSILDDVRFEKELKRMAVFVPDRKQLFMLIDDKRFSKAVSKATDTTDVDSNKNKKGKSPKKTSLSTPPYPVATSDYVNWLEENAEDLPAANESENRFKHQELIDSFMESESKQSGPRLGSLVGNDLVEKDNKKEVMSEQGIVEKTSLDDSYFTETLARVYINQKRYDKALEIIRVLSLKYPEKNIYFADQIRYLEKIINIKK